MIEELQGLVEAASGVSGVVNVTGPIGLIIEPDFPELVIDGSEGIEESP